MPRYLVVRRFDVAESAMPQVGRKSRVTIEEEFPQITWEHSHVIVDDDGVVRTYCVYAAPAEQARVRNVVVRLERDRELRRDLPPARVVTVRDQLERLAVEHDRLLLRPAALGLAARG